MFGKESATLGDLMQNQQVKKQLRFENRRNAIASGYTAAIQLFQHMKDADMSKFFQVADLVASRYEKQLNESSKILEEGTDDSPAKATNS